MSVGENMKMQFRPDRFTKFNRFMRSFSRLARSQNGNVTMIFTLATIPVVGAMGVAIDYARISKETTSLAAAVDSALLAAIGSERSKLNGLSEAQKAANIDELKVMVGRYLEDNYSSERSAGIINATLAINGDKVTMTAKHTMPMTLMSILGTPSVDITVTSEATRGQRVAKPVEMALVMDTTGSMGSTYMNQAKTAARNLLNTLYDGDKTAKPENPNIRLSLVPFAAAVRLDRSAYDFDMDWIDTTGQASVSKLNFSSTSWHNYMAWTQLSNRPWNGCVEARARGSAPFNYNVNDEPPSTGGSLFTPYFAPDEPTFSGSTSSPYNFDNSYISNSGTPQEATGISSSTSSSNHAARQKNVNKYINKSIASEASSTYGPWCNCVKSPVVPMTYTRLRD